MSSQAFAPAPVPQLLRVQNLAKTYVRRASLAQRGTRIQAAIAVSFTMEAGSTLGLAGSSGCGKSTVARCVTRIERPDEGEILFEGHDLAGLSLRELRRFRPAIQMMFQDAATAMNPRFSAAEIISEPLLIQGVLTAEERMARVHQAMREVGLPAEWAGRAAHEFSGGQRQRLTLARALVLKPKLLVLDEPLTGLDVSTRAQIANLLLDLQAAHRIAYLFISHDLSLLAHLADRIAVMCDGRLAEEGSTLEIMSCPQHAETKKLLAATGRQPVPAGAVR
ncbi:MAG TPA: dipeptide/oligopeptide/nickel ABC transporter ATP-binding protein [Terriglobales bacterium]|nr:dipeptide/oligopeptide/nickel ABC transporter ATP-binding protein [Terriglobales bacterium]